MSRVAAKLLKSAFRRGGIEVRRYRDGFHWAPDYYGRSFAFRTDIRETPIFGELARQVVAENRSCLYYDRLYVLFQAMCNLRRYAANNASVRIVEVGVFRGGTSAYLAQLAIALDLPFAQIHSFDTFEGHAEADVDRAIDSVHRPGDFSDTSYEAVVEYLRRYPNVTVHKGRFEDRCDVLGNEPLSLLHLDVDLYAPTLHALEFADKRLITGGMCIVDDYETRSCPGVKRAIDEFLASHPQYFALHPLTEQCMLVKCT